MSVSPSPPSSPATATKHPPSSRARPRRALIRRQDSFTKLQGLQDKLESWFIRDEALAIAFSEFARAHVDASPAFEPKTSAHHDSSTTARSAAGAAAVDPADDPHFLQQIDHAAHAVHEKFCILFEAELEAFLERSKVTYEQFEATMEISKQEELTQGLHFYRWMDCIEFPVFFALMRGCAKNPANGGVTAMRKKVAQNSVAARTEYRRRAELDPLIMKWCPSSFSEIWTVLNDEAIKKEFPQHLDKPTLKELSRWKTKLSTKVLGINGVYTDAVDPADWVTYLGVYTQNMSSDDFTGFVAFVDRQVTSQKGEQGDAAKVRKAIWQCFADIDVLKKGKLSGDLVVDILATAPQVLGSDYEHAVKAEKKLRIKLQSYFKNEARNKFLTAAESENPKSDSAKPGGDVGDSDVQLPSRTEPIEVWLRLTDFEKLLHEVYDGHSSARDKFHNFRGFVIGVHRHVMLEYGEGAGGKGRGSTSSPGAVSFS